MYPMVRARMTAINSESGAALKARGEGAREDQQPRRRRSGEQEGQVEHDTTLIRASAILDSQRAGITPEGWIGRAIWNNTGRALKVHRGLLASQTPPDVWVKIRVGLKGNLQGCLADLSCLTRSKRSIMSAGMGYRALISSKIRSWSLR